MQEQKQVTGNAICNNCGAEFKSTVTNWDFNMESGEWTHKCTMPVETWGQKLERTEPDYREKLQRKKR